jgi:hypothetical protein
MDKPEPITAETVEVTKVGALPLAVFFGPAEIRDHFEGNDGSDPDEPDVDDLSDEDLARLAVDAVWDDRVWEAFHDSLVDAVKEYREQTDTPAVVTR